MPEAGHKLINKYRMLGPKSTSTHKGIPHMDAFDTKRYLGKWYEAARTAAIPFQKGDYVTATYTLKENGKIDVFNEEKRSDGKIHSARGEAVPDSTGVPGRLTVKFDNFFARLFPGHYMVLETDYDNYSLVYSPFSFLFFKRRYAWILVRDVPVEKELLESLFQRMEEYTGLTKSDFRITEQ